MEIFSSTRDALLTPRCVFSLPSGKDSGHLQSRAPLARSRLPHVLRAARQSAASPAVELMPLPRAGKNRQSISTTRGLAASLIQGKFARARRRRAQIRCYRSITKQAVSGCSAAAAPAARNGARSMPKASLRRLLPAPRALPSGARTLNGDFHPAVLRPALWRVIRGDRSRVADPLGRNDVGIDPLRDQKIDNRRRPSRRQH